MENLRIERMTNETAAFYATIGPYLSRRAIVKELGFPVWDDDGKEWFVARSGGKVVGFAATRSETGKVVLCSAYVLPDHRGKGVYSRLIKDRLASLPTGAVVAATATAASKPALAKAGFKAVGRAGRYTKMRKEIA